MTSPLPSIDPGLQRSFFAFVGLFLFPLILVWSVTHKRFKCNNISKAARLWIISCELLKYFLFSFLFFLIPAGGPKVNQEPLHSVELDRHGSPVRCWHVYVPPGRSRTPLNLADRPFKDWRLRRIATAPSGSEAGFRIFLGSKLFRQVGRSLPCISP